MLPRVLTSVAMQRDVEVEHVVVDNGSTDATSDALEGCAQPGLHVVRNEDSLGPTGGRNTGLAEARGDWLAILDDDDLWAPDKLSAQLAAAERTGRSWAYTGCVYIDSEDRIIGGRPPDPPDQVMTALPTRWVIDGGISNILWRRGVLDEDLLDENLRVTVDWDLALRLARTGPPAWVPRPLVAYRQHGGNFSRHVDRHLDELDHIEDKFADLRGGRSLDRGVQHRFVGSEALRIGDRRAALRAYGRGLRAGDIGCAVRAAATLVPTRVHPWLRRRFLSDPNWIADARSWLDDIIGDLHEAD